MNEEPLPLSDEEIKFVRDMMKEKELVRLFWLSVFRWAAIIGGVVTFGITFFDWIAKHLWRG